VIALAGLLAGCAGVRTGYFSRPYTGAPGRCAGPSIAYERDRMLEISLPGLSMHIDLLNSWQLSDSIWFGLGVPLIPLRVERCEPTGISQPG